MGKRKYDYTPRERMRTCTIVALLAYVLTVMMPSQNVVSQVMMARILSGGTPIEESDGAFPLDWLLLLHRALAQRSTLLAAVAVVLRSEVTKYKTIIEHVYGKVTSMFKYAGTHLHTKNEDPGTAFAVAILLVNCHTTLYGSSMTSRFYSGLALKSGSLTLGMPPTLESYLRGAPTH
jgi:hypothetical protein